MEAVANGNWVGRRVWSEMEVGGNCGKTPGVVFPIGKEYSRCESVPAPVKFVDAAGVG